MSLLQERKIEYINPFPFEAELGSVRHMPPHYHDGTLEILLVLKGSVKLISNHEHAVLTEGQFFSLDPRDIHSLSSDEDNMVLQFHLNIKDKAIAWNHAEYLMFACQSSLCQPHQREYMLMLKDLILSLSFMYLNRIVPAEATGQDPEIDGYERTLNNLLDILYKHFNWFNYSNTEEFDPEIHERMYSLYGYCVEHMQEKITIPMLAEYVHLSQNYLSQFMRKTSFESFSTMLQYVRCYEAEHLMLETNLSNADIAFNCGFSDAKYFYAAFTRWWEETPAVFRKKMKKLLDMPENVHKASHDEAAGIMERYILQWHLDKTTKSLSELF